MIKKKPELLAYYFITYEFQNNFCYFTCDNKYFSEFWTFPLFLYSQNNDSVTSFALIKQAMLNASSNVTNVIIDIQPKSFSSLILLCRIGTNVIGVRILRNNILPKITNKILLIFNFLVIILYSPIVN